MKRESERGDRRGRVREGRGEEERKREKIGEKERRKRIIFRLVKEE